MSLSSVASENGVDAFQAYKAVTIYEPFTALDYIYVEEFSRPAKPFIFLSGSITYSGLCVDY
jgi:hypothetical protein